MIDPALDQALQRIEARERASRRMAVSLTLIPVLAAFAFLGYGAWRVHDATQQVEELRDEARRFEAAAETLRAQVDALQSDLARTREELSEARSQLEATVDVARFRHDLDFVQSKEIASLYPRAAEALTRMVELRERGLDWHLGGRSPQEGFDSPGFAAWLLDEFGILDVDAARGESLLATSRRLFDLLEPVDEPAVGDLAFYPAGYVLFFFEDARGQPFVMGMTPYGIVALEPDFSPPLGFRRSGLSRSR